MKFLLFIALTLSSLYSQADSDVLCSESKGAVGGTIFYKSFLTKSGLEQAYTFFYKSVDNILDENILKSCPKLSKSPSSEEVAKMEMFLNEHHALCNNTCEELSAPFHEQIETRFFKKSKIKQLQKECKLVCQIANNTELSALEFYTQKGDSSDTLNER